ncbi:TATA-box-binding protein (TATA sequence-binding protein) (TBP) (TATA-binding factor) (TATA-box factor) (Transcription initiation factor TFIID TBP subunit) [Durusdinium trenchii]|uniref:TATA-box-binding protein (TATA sequence-binding protein) (TBP) (TATA-binding factor) (TATA-box factor) (Transcription initiation factor TFIID TBP subunit) n=1 Tax=Durusdinium trenchii TaxID=1381693 RepID=A0ABP0RIQ5_9DINO
MFVHRCSFLSLLNVARFADYGISSILCKADLGFPVRLDQLASKFRRNALYEPEFFCSCVFRTKKPKCTYLVTAGGKVSISGLRTMEDVQEALRRAYFVFKEFRN